MSDPSFRLVVVVPDKILKHWAFIMNIVRKKPYVQLNEMKGMHDMIMGLYGKDLQLIWIMFIAFYVHLCRIQ